MNIDEHEKAFEANPLRHGAWVLFKVGLLLTLIGLAFTSIGYVVGWFGEAATVAKKEFGPREALKKYEWFKDAAAQLEKKQADIKVYAARERSMLATYEGVSRREWARPDLEQFNLWNTEVAGVTASYNALAADYNAQMSKFNWRFAERGMQPPVASEPMPREFKPYEEK